MLERDGYLEIEEIERIPGFPGRGALSRKKVAILECAQEIPCDPCEAACPQGAIRVGSHITNLPAIDPEKCTGCGTCVAKCPGLAVFVLDLTKPNHDVVTMPYEYLPLPEADQEVACLDRRGAMLGSGRVKRISTAKANDRTAVVTVEVPKGLGMEVRAIRVDDDVSAGGLEGVKEPPKGGLLPQGPEDPDDMLICRCEEVTRKEVIEAIREGAVTVDAVKRRTRAGMGLCQGRNCGKTVSRLIAEELGKPVSSVPPASKRPPVRPVKLSVFAAGEDAPDDDN